MIRTRSGLFVPPSAWFLWRAKAAWRFIKRKIMRVQEPGIFRVGCAPIRAPSRVRYHKGLKP